MNNENKLQEVPPHLLEAHGQLFATQIDVLLIDVARAADLYKRMVVTKLAKSAHRNPQYEFLVNNIERYVTTIIVSAIVINPEAENPDNYRGLPHHVLTKLWHFSWLYQGLSGLGPVYYRSFGVRRVVSYLEGEKFNLMDKTEAMRYSSDLHEALKDETNILVLGVPHNDEGIKEQMSLTIVEDNNVEKLATHIDAGMNDKAYAVTLFPKLKEPSTRIPAVILQYSDVEGTVSSIRTTNGFI